VTTAVAEARAGAAPKRGLAERRLPPATHSAERPGASEVAPRSEPSTLEDALLGAWEDLGSHGRAECLVCGGPVEAGPAGGQCEACGSALS
jgi:hypothetical protein